jgi:hypothetical protein
MVDARTAFTCSLLHKFETFPVQAATSGCVKGSMHGKGRKIGLRKGLERKDLTRNRDRGARQGLPDPGGLS